MMMLYLLVIIGRDVKLSVNLTLAAIEPCKLIGSGNGLSTSDAVS